MSGAAGELVVDSGAVVAAVGAMVVLLLVGWAVALPLLLGVAEDACQWWRSR
ncbi:MAG: hypothetical protein KatS3mg108_0534 [Isosphaeraceae bacterium]|jgi:hypothetical protein|nr:MAG: hypothetical protein KatS3mg108_0534 [Isosphaeraceae bacterium]